MVYIIIKSQGGAIQNTTLEINKRNTTFILAAEMVNGAAHAGRIADSRGSAPNTSSNTGWNISTASAGSHTWIFYQEGNDEGNMPSQVTRMPMGTYVRVATEANSTLIKYRDNTSASGVRNNNVNNTNKGFAWGSQWNNIANGATMTFGNMQIHDTVRSGDWIRTEHNNTQFMSIFFHNR